MHILSEGLDYGPDILLGSLDVMSFSNSRFIPLLSYNSLHKANSYALLPIVSFSP